MLGSSMMFSKYFWFSSTSSDILRHYIYTSLLWRECIQEARIESHKSKLNTNAIEDESKQKVTTEKPTINLYKIDARNDA